MTEENEQLQVYSVRLSTIQIDFLKTLGEGNSSAFIRESIDKNWAARKKNGASKEEKIIDLRRQMSILQGKIGKIKNHPDYISDCKTTENIYLTHVQNQVKEMEEFLATSNLNMTINQFIYTIGPAKKLSIRVTSQEIKNSNDRVYDFTKTIIPEVIIDNGIPKSTPRDQIRSARLEINEELIKKIGLYDGIKQLLKQLQMPDNFQCLHKKAFMDILINQDFPESKFNLNPLVELFLAETRQVCEELKAKLHQDSAIKVKAAFDAQIQGFQKEIEELEKQIDSI